MLKAQKLRKRYIPSSAWRDIRMHHSEPNYTSPKSHIFREFMQVGVS